MKAFPQLSSGAAGQFPFQKEIRFRTTINKLGDGTEKRFADEGFEQWIWELSLSNLTDAEWRAIVDLFEDTRGRLGDFVFLEPGANLLRWSEDLSRESWAASGVSLSAGQTDPFGAARAVRLTTGGGGLLYQRLDIPAGRRYAGSAWFRTADAGVKLRISDGAGAQAETAVASDNHWRRYSAGYVSASSGESIRFEILFTSGGSATVFGPQLEAQVAPSAYKATNARCGVFPNARFESDSLSDEAAGPGGHAGVVRISWARSQF